MEKKRLIWLDAAKGVAILLVILGHTMAFLSLIRRTIFSFHMPLFFIAAGYTFSAKSIGDQAKNSARRLLIPYCLLFLSATIVGVFLQNGGKELPYLISRIPSFIWAAGDGWQGIESVGATWFLVVLFGSRLLFNQLSRFFEDRSIGIAHQTIIVCALALAGYLVGSVAFIWLPFDLDVVPIATLFMWIGWCARRHQLVEKAASLPGIACLLAVWIIAVRFSSLEMATRDYSLFPLAIIGAASGSLLIMACLCKFEKQSEGHAAYALFSPLSFLGRNSLKLFCIHCFDFYLPWNMVTVSILGHHNLTVGAIKILFDVLVLVLFELFL